MHIIYFCESVMSIQQCRQAYVICTCVSMSVMSSKHHIHRVVYYMLYLDNAFTDKTEAIHTLSSKGMLWGNQYCCVYYSYLILHYTMHLCIVWIQSVL